MSKYLEYFPRIYYDAERKKLSNYQIVTDITFRLGIIKNVLSNISAFYYYTVQDGETPEIVAEKFYGSAEAHWIVLYANEIYDPQYDWPLSFRSFKNYLVNKYRNQAAVALSISNTAITDTQILSWSQDTTSANSVHHYEKQIIRYNRTDDVYLTMNLEVNGTNVTSNTAVTAPYDFYTTANTYDPRALEFTGSYETYNINGKTIEETIKGAFITYYDYELEENEKKRNIIIIKKEYYPQLMEEFKSLTGGGTEPYIRKLI
jgi:hypothetical protein